MSVAVHRRRLRPGKPDPIGVTWDGAGVNVALFSAHATRVEFCLFNPNGAREVERHSLPERTDHVWHGHIAGVQPGDLYGFRVHGPYEPDVGHRFNANKLLIDPYAKLLSGKIKWSDAHYGYRTGSSRADLSFDRRDSARMMPKAVVVDGSFPWAGHQKPAIPWSSTVIYEAHVRGLTKRHPAVPKGRRGTFAGLADEAIIQYLKALGVTAVELMPVQSFTDDRFLVDKGLVNYWGYQTIGFFAPDGRYLAASRLEELKSTVKRLHDAGIEVILDVVYNHTGEGNELGPTLSFRGIDNASYYRLDPANKRYYLDLTGCGNTLDLNHPRVLQMVLDSLRYWASEIQVDGFRFDLASALGREAGGFDPRAGFFDAIAQDPVLRTCKLIAEPWDVGPNGYQLGQYPTPWGEWNDRFRDTVRAFWRGDSGVLPELAGRLSGSADLFDHNGRGGHASVNFVAAHDGFTVADVVRYRSKHNLANGEDNRDGHSHNLSDNYGVEGPTDDPQIEQLRIKQQRNLLATALLARGTPMLLAGDEVGRTQHGNNNAYCQDNEISWFDWDMVEQEANGLTDFVRRVLALRRRHPVLTRKGFLHGRAISPRGLPDIMWLNSDGGEMTVAQWHDTNLKRLMVVLSSDAGPDLGPDGKPRTGGVVLLALNADTEPVNLTLPVIRGGRLWQVQLETERARPPERPATLHMGEVYSLAPRALVLMELLDVGRIS